MPADPTSTPTPTLASLAAALPNGAQPLPGVITAGQPAAADLSALAGAGCRAVLDIRTPDEDRGFDEPDAARALGLEYLNVPVTSETLDDAAFARVREVLRDAGRRPLLLHCKSANRVGAVLIPYLVLDEGQPLGDACAAASRVGLRAAPLLDLARDYVARQTAGA